MRHQSSLRNSQSKSSVPRHHVPINVFWLMVALMRTTWSSVSKQPIANQPTHLDGLVALQQLTQLKQQKIRVHRPFMDFVYDDMRNTLEICVSSCR